ncbi:hypothetical protein N0V93_000892 [Gnomoniopsis smithogilvyi]|uniref:Peptide N-acetyl-beta-D-glucosaminyl asparaginase amidase A N-terminal domain-containing protein n=1 Tax=Gnomoniopsis smithogilvyi TaxID=1191159 RepID=A0A9W8Z0L6_9PEZI|nr:hypothetical protein N0V93_000892 [Gnomoniopsis smithogilvyi]
MQALETDCLGKAMREPGASISGPRKAKKQRASMASMVYLAIAAFLGTLLLFKTIRGCQEHHQRPHLSSGKWTHKAEHVLHGSGHKPEAIDGDTPTDVEVHRHEDKLGMVRRASATSTAASATGTVLVDYQVHQPVLTPEGATLDSGASNGEAGEVQDSCQVVLMDYVFAYSYGEPYIGEYTPPDCDFNRVAINFTVVSEGRQFDRLALMYFNDTEVWRTSTAEPTTAPGIRWTYLKDMTEYLSLWNSPQKLIFDLGNLITDVYTGDFNTTLTATFFLDDSVDVATASPADLIIPISARQSASDGVSQFTLPADNATNTIAFPQNVKRAVFSVSANGQSTEEFWWSNVLQSDVSAFAATAGTFYGYSPWREVQVFIDGQLAGVDWPFPVIFTGGVVPSLHRPIVGPDAFDLKEHEIDITPWLGVLCDGANHTFTIYVAGLLDNGGSEATITQTVGSSWYVTGKIFVWLDSDADSITTGTAPVISAGEPEITVSQSLTTSANGTVNETLTYDTAVSRSYSVSATITSQNSSSTVGWTQSLSYSNKGYVWAEGYAQINDFLTSGSDAAVSSADGIAGANYKTQYKYPLYCNTSYSYSTEGNLTIFADVIQGQEVYVEGAAVFPDGLEAFAVDGSSYTGSLVNNSKEGIAYFFEYADATVSSGYGSTDETFTFGGFTGTSGSIDATPDEVLYSRHVQAANSTITSDVEVLSGSVVAASDTGVSATASGSKIMYAQTPADGGNGATRLFMNRQLS